MRVGRYLVGLLGGLASTTLVVTNPSHALASPTISEVPSATPTDGTSNPIVVEPPDEAYTTVALREIKSLYPNDSPALLKQKLIRVDTPIMQIVDQTVNKIETPSTTATDEPKTTTTPVSSNRWDVSAVYLNSLIPYVTTQAISALLIKAQLSWRQLLLNRYTLSVSTLVTTGTGAYTLGVFEYVHDISLDTRNYFEDLYVYYFDLFEYYKAEAMYRVSEWTQDYLSNPTTENMAVLEHGLFRFSQLMIPFSVYLLWRCGGMQLLKRLASTDEVELFCPRPCWLLAC